MTRTETFIRVISNFSAKRILVVGDLTLDVYLKGRSTRLCPEAPVPVVDIDERTVVPGCAANTVCNLQSLGATVSFCTVIGADPEGAEAMRLLENLGVNLDSIIRVPGRRTITKSRVVSGSQVITRIDQGSEEEVSSATTDALFTRITREYENCDAVIFSDYAKGVITQELLDRFQTFVNRKRKFIAVDSKRLRFFSSLRPSYAKPNYDEVTKLLGLSNVKDRIQQIVDHAKEVSTATNTRLISVTLDALGSLNIENGKVTRHLTAPAIDRPHVSGAGDTYIAAFVAAYLESGDSILSGEIANAAASIAVAKEGTTVCTQAELKSYFNIHYKYIADPEALKSICDSYHQSGRRIVFTNGCFDILHSGHVTYLHKARSLGDVLIVGLNTDESIKRIKGSGRPINGLADRLQVLAGLSSVDHIVPFGSEEDDTPVPLIRAARPHVFAKGGDYTADKLPEARTVQECGGEIVFIDQVPDHSTTRIISRIHSMKTSDEETTALFRSGS